MEGTHEPLQDEPLGRLTDGRTRFSIGTGVACHDGPCGHLTRVVIDPVARAVTHIVVEPKHRRGCGRLVPVDLIDVVTDEIRLRCTVQEFARMERAEETEFFPGTSGDWSHDEGEGLAWPYYTFIGLGGMWGGGSAAPPLVHDRIPAGEVEVRRGESVHATDGAIGRVQGLVIDPRHHHVTHILLQEGHLWGRKQVAIPIDAVQAVEDGIQLGIAKREVQHLPAIRRPRLSSSPGSSPHHS